MERTHALSGGPKIDARHTKMLLSLAGEAEQPCGGSVDICRKSLCRRSTAEGDFAIGRVLLPVIRLRSPRPGLTLLLHFVRGHDAAKAKQSSRFRTQVTEILQPEDRRTETPPQVVAVIQSLPAYLCR